MNTIKMIFLFTVLFCNAQFAQNNLRKIVELKGLWAFSIGDDEDWSKINFDDKEWDRIKAPSNWEDQGYHGYDGFAWYRKNFTIRSKDKNNNYVLTLGRIDDVSEIYVNEKLIGINGMFPPNYKTAYNEFRQFIIPSSLIKYNKKNVIAIRVYDAELSGGLVDGELEISAVYDDLKLELNLAGEWKFQTEDNLAWKSQTFDDKKWKSVFVPSSWESQGFQNYDGFAWYRKTFFLPENLKNKKLILLLGKIDDIDEVYLNGKLIGSTGNMKNTEKFRENNNWNSFRSYFISDNSILNYGGKNVIAVRVYDGFNVGGIYEGPIGIAEQKEFAKYWRKKSAEETKIKNNFWDFFFD